MKIKKKTLFLIAVFALVIPLIMGMLMHVINVNFIDGSSDGWLGFWGGYLGTMFSIFVGMYISFQEAQKSAEESRKASIEETKKLAERIKMEAEKEQEIKAWFMYIEYEISEYKQIIKYARELEDYLLETLKFSTDSADMYRAHLSLNLIDIYDKRDKLSITFNSLQPTEADIEIMAILTSKIEYLDALTDSNFTIEELDEMSKARVNNIFETTDELTQGISLEIRANLNKMKSKAKIKK